MGVSQRHGRLRVPKHFGDGGQLYAPCHGLARHRGLRQLCETDSSRLLKQDLADRVRGILAALAMAETMEDFIREAAPGWRVHRLSGARRDEWRVSVSGDWRITFEERDGAIGRVNLEDYH